MKISKLFHWLYAFVMLLPVFAIGVTCGYAIFNKNAYLNSNIEQEKVYIESPIYNEHYYMDTDFKVNNNSDLVMNIDNLNSINYYDSNFGNVTSIRTTFVGAVTTFQFRDSSNSVLFTTNSNNSFTFDFDLVNITSGFQFFNYLKLYQYEEIKLNNVFYYAVDKVTESPLFNWAYNSFLVAPFSYIVVLFSMPSNSPVVMLLSYWLAISIIWLVFDLVMYVPLLVHRWLDKGVLE